MALIKLNNRSSEDTAIHGRRNLIINGAMQVNQRAFTSSSATNDNAFVADRLKRYQNGMTTGAGTNYYSTLTSSDSPFLEGIRNAYRMSVTTAESSLGATVDSQVWMQLEAQNTDIVGWGTSSAKNMTLSFWVKSHITGKYYIWTGYHDGTTQKYCSPSYTINSANTWEYKTVTIPAFTNTDGVIQTRTNETGLFFTFYHAAGSNLSGSVSGTSWTTNSSDRIGTDAANIYASTGDFYLTGLQLEVGDTATPFEHRSFGEELALCERYYQVGHVYRGINNDQEISFDFQHRTKMRIASGSRTYTKLQGTVTDSLTYASNASSENNTAYYRSQADVWGHIKVTVDSEL